MRAPLRPSGLRKRRVVATGRRRARRGGGIVRIGRGAFERAEHDGDVGDGLRHGAGGVLIGGDRNHAVAADAADGGLDGREHVLIGRAENRARGFGADVGGPEIRGGADAGAGPAGGERGASVVGGLARIAARIVGIEAESADRVVVAGHRRGRAGHPVGELGHAGLGDDDGAGVAQVFHQRGVVGRHESVKGERSAGGDDVAGEDVVLERDGDAVQRSANVALGALAIELVGFRRARWDSR